MAVLTVLAACPLLFLGAEVTTKGVGMADQRSVVAPWQALSEFDGQSLGFKIEHAHRIAGWLVGLLGVVLAVALWATTAPRWLQVLGTAALFGIATQGILGIFRVQLNALFGPALAWAHGSFAPLVFATLVSVAWLTSARARERTSSDRASRAKPQAALRFGSSAVVAVVYLQVLVGGLVRHQPTLLAARGHLLGAFAATAGLLWLVWQTWTLDGSRWTNRLLLGLLTLQVLLGVESWLMWMNRLYAPGMAGRESVAAHWLRSSHYFIGVMLFACAVVAMLQSWRIVPTLRAAHEVSGSLTHPAEGSA